ncbi:MAG: trypsin-like peptidase domain-containing protein [Pirellulaceae bacterium]|nr:trypsin-like peptidase domain-containing protein [Pirellulaceae bacterium]
MDLTRQKSSLSTLSSTILLLGICFVFPPKTETWAQEKQQLQKVTLHEASHLLSDRGLSENTRTTLSARSNLHSEILEEAAYLERQGNLLKKVVRFVKPSVIHIEAVKKGKTGRYGTNKPVEETGSGVIVSWNEKFYVITNRHVIHSAAIGNIKLRLASGKVAYPKKVWTDEGTDIAVMEVSDTTLTPAVIGDSNEMEIGDFVLAVGSPFGLSHSVTYGIISAKGRRDLKLGTANVQYQDFMQTDAAINPGNSGGPLLNLKGELIGINTAIASNSGGSEGIGFTIPINMAMSVAGQLIEKGHVERAFLGVQLDSKFTPEVATRMGLPHFKGARVSGVTPESPAEKAGVRVGDVVVQFEERQVEDDSHLVNLVSAAKIGQKVELGVYRDGQPLRLILSVQSRKAYEQR